MATPEADEHGRGWPGKNEKCGALQAGGCEGGVVRSGDRSLKGYRAAGLLIAGGYIQGVQPECASRA